MSAPHADHGGSPPNQSLERTRWARSTRFAGRQSCRAAQLQIRPSMAVRLVVATLLLLSGAACREATVSASGNGAGGDLVDALRSAVQVIGAREPVAAVVYDASASKLEIRALHQTGLHVFSLDEVRTAKIGLPAGHLFMRSLTLHDQSGEFRGTLGPIGITPPGVASFDCGTTYSVELLRKAGGNWVATISSVMVC